ncbi:MAG: hypothetical protein PHT99_03720 [Methanoregula sp.]|nr:hypothetical protein [Methanoregula sp.]
MAGCSGQRTSQEKVVNLTGQTLNVVQSKPTPDVDPYANFIKSEKTVSVANNITELLIYWNANLHWNLSHTQIDAYTRTLENGIVLKKYMTNPDYPHALFISDEHQFYREVGMALGFTRSESEDFVKALDDLRWQKYTSDCPQWDTCGPPKSIDVNFSVKPRLLVNTP